ncbi:efflux transporter outer membrane subunit [Piscinibacter sp.]|uniref:efflux transporter outer membrane subunit n=1 Tax=Piscinibacter sp. TaxID=1903157 RepID=UPI002BCB03C4|nr:efflux transporter outer membrane subunit [Albitalea sp.]HUG25343.1 efflux transporter outer membrane subunit [Albitalea sp.]
MNRGNARWVCGRPLTPTRPPRKLSPGYRGEGAATSSFSLPAPLPLPLAGEGRGKGAREQPLRPWFAALLLAVAGCATKVGPDHTPPEPNPPAQFGPAIEQLGPPTTHPGGWWQGFGDPALDALVAQALARNLDVAAAAARVDEARALLRSVEAARSPSVAAQAGAGVDERVTGSSGNGNRDDEGGRASASAIFGWTLDLFGGRARAVEAAAAELRRREALQSDLARTTAVEVVRGYIALRLAVAELALLDDSLRLQDRTHEIVRVRREAGLASQLDLNRAAAEVAATRARQGPLRLSRESARHALAVLAGEWPRALVLPEAASPRVPRYAGGPAPGTPRELLRRRPDLAAAEANLALASAEIGVAQARLYPSLSLPGTLTATATGLGSGSVVTGIVASLSAVLDIPLFDGGGRRAQVDAANARAQEALFVYRRTLLDALQEAETALVAVGSARSAETEFAVAVDASARAFEQAQVLYREGLAGFLEVLDAQRTLIANREALARARADLARALADIHGALGGAPVAT